MTETFKIGDKVEHRTWGAGEIAFGPFLRDASPDNYLIKQDRDGEHRLAEADAMTRLATFKVGDKVKSRIGAVYTIEAGPFFAPGKWYALKSVETGNVVHSSADEVSLVAPEPADEPLKVGDVVRILEDGAYHADVKAGDLFEVKETFRNAFWAEDRIKVDAGPDARMSQWTFRPEDFEKVSADEATVLDGKVYDLTARYRDRDDDYWTFKRVDGEVRGECSATNTDLSHRIDKHSDSLAEALEFGPLTRVNA